jgi:hypothetical protein
MSEIIEVDSRELAKAYEEGYKAAEEKFVKAIYWEIAIWGGFKKIVLDVMLNVLKTAAPQAHQEALAMLPAKHPDDE